MIGTARRLRDPARPRPGHRPRLHAPLRPRPRGRRLRPGPDRLRLGLVGGHPGRGLRRRSTPSGSACSSRTGRAVVFADPGLADLRHPRPVLRGPGGGAHHHRRQRRRAAPRGRLPRRTTSATPAPTSTSRSCAAPGTSPSRSTTRARYYRFEDFTPGRCFPYQDRHLHAVLRRLARAAAYRVGAKHADTYMLWGEPLAGDRRADRARHGQPPRPPAAHRGRGSRCRSARSSAAPTSEAWERAHGILDTDQRRGRPGVQAAVRAGGARRAGARRTPGSQRLLAAAEKGDLHDRCLWTPTTTAVGGGGNSTALVGIARDRGGGDPRLRRHRRQHRADPRLRPAPRRHRLRHATCCRWSARSSRTATPLGRCLRPSDQ